MGHRQALSGGDEYDCVHARRYYNWNPGSAKGIKRKMNKRKMNKRERRAAMDELTAEAERLGMYDEPSNEAAPQGTAEV